MFHTILIANRGEIACRVMATAQRMGIRCVAVYSEADADALFVKRADEAVCIGAAPARESYLLADRVLDAARCTGAQAIHPGYGFLSENAGFARACADAGITFIGPPAEAIEAMGLKDAAKARMERAGVPVVPGYHGQEQSPAVLEAEAERIGFPVLIKAVAGGGGKGMRRVDDAASFPAALEGARREGEASFGDGRVLVEKYLLKPRHIEVQVFADRAGEAVHLFERDCSLQRRHQKVVEEAPAPGMSEALRARMGEAAVTAARAIGYEGAGTVEFITDVSGGLEDAPFYFMEMNTRLQVEHPVTEAISGVDLVEWQLRVAAGEPLPRTQGQLAIHGHAVEVRLYAEDPQRDYLPQTGTLERLRWPRTTDGVRIDTGVTEGDRVSVHYDPMIAKVVTHGVDREQALSRMHRALGELRVAGLVTNRALLRSVVAHRAFRAGDVDTGFLLRHADDLLPARKTVPPELVPLAVAGLLERRAAAAYPQPGADAHSPWGRTDGFRLNELGRDVLRFDVAGGVLQVEVLFEAAGPRLCWDGHDVPLAAMTLADGVITVVASGSRRSADYLDDGERITVVDEDQTLVLVREAPDASAEDSGGAGGVIKSPMPGKVLAVLVGNGESVSQGQALLRLEAMKMEHTLQAPCDGVVRELSVGEGEQVDEDVPLLSVVAPEK